MSPAVSDRSGAKRLVRALKALGAPRGVGRALAVGPQGHDLGRAAAELLSPSELVLLHPTPSAARARFRTAPGDLAAFARAEPGSFDLVLVAGGLETGELAAVRATVAAPTALLRPGGVLVAAIDTFAAPLSGDSAAASAPLLFPQLAQSGALGEEARARAPLPAAAWTLMFQDAGLEIVACDVAGLDRALDDLMAEHGRRLAAYDAQELSQGRIHLLARKPEARPCN